VARVVIGVDPHKRSATIEIMNHREKAIGKGRFGTDRDGYQAMLAAGRKHTDRIWAVEGCSGIGRHVAQRLVADGENVVDVPAKLSARARVFATGQGRKTDPVDAHSVAVAALRTDNLRQVTIDDTTVALRLLVDRRELLGRTRTETVSRLHHLLLELVPGGAKKFLSTQQARALLNTVRPRDVVGKTRRWLASELIHELAVIDKKIKIADAELTELVKTTGSTLQNSPVSDRPDPLVSWATSVTSAASPAADTSRPGTAPLPSTRRQATRTGTACPGPETGGSTGFCTSWPWSNSGATPKAAATTDENSPPARLRWKPCAL
jgi:hypothetical protein